MTHRPDARASQCFALLRSAPQTRTFTGHHLALLSWNATSAGGHVCPQAGGFQLKREVYMKLKLQIAQGALINLIVALYCLHLLSVR